MKKNSKLLYYLIIATIPIEIAILLGKFLGFLFIPLGILCFMILEYYYIKNINKIISYKVGVIDNLLFSLLFPIIFFILSIFNSFVFDGTYKQPKSLNISVLSEVYFTFIVLFFILWNFIYLVFRENIKAGGSGKEFKK